MSRLLRPHIGLETRCRVVLRQLGEFWPDDVLAQAKMNAIPLKEVLAIKLKMLASVLLCEVGELRLDHDPPLGGRRKVFRKGVHVGYQPPANSTEHLRYRPHGARHRGSHDVKTRVRGDRGQLSDIALVKRNRRQEEREGTRPKSARTRAREQRKEARHKRMLRGPDSSRTPKAQRAAAAWVRRVLADPPRGDKPKRKWPKRPFPKRRRK